MPIQDVNTTNSIPILDYADPRISTRRIFLDWESRRLTYNIILVVISLLTVAIDPRLFSRLDLWLQLMLGAIAANIFYLAGPAVESYLNWLGYHRRFIRLTLFLGGCILASILAVICIAASGFSHLLPSQN